MRAVVQRVASAAVRVGDEEVGAIGVGLVVLLAVATGDGEPEARWMASKIASIRIFPDGDERMDRDVRQVGGQALVVSQFTLYGDVRRGRRPSFIGSARPDVARPLVDRTCELLRAEGVPVQTGRFGASMAVSLLNDGPVTLILDSP